MTAGDGSAVDLDALLNEIEGHLLVDAARAEARTAAAELTAGLGLLTESEREEVVRRFTERYLALSRTSWQRTARRGEELRAQYETRYRLLRQRLLGCALLGCALALGTVLVALSAG
ncbi:MULTISPECIES: hypothetical protein [Streptomyces]|uniref:Uncharacterized protein n=1 Tax=Streptomyces edwardsiae TaxID=3075527 RepID=A0ABU2QUD7_9ACTN|nr:MULTISPECIES: hypothetical protein [unclassified Streptomyces]MDT0406710.1 hypothetical protein [Streptomyces sp. DSM 41635]